MCSPTYARARAREKERERERKRERARGRERVRERERECVWEKYIEKKTKEIEWQNDRPALSA